MKYMMVLEDGETFADLAGSCIVQVSDDFDDDHIELTESTIVAAFQVTEEGFISYITNVAPVALTDLQSS